MNIGDLIRELQRHPLNMEVYLESEHGDVPVVAVNRVKFDYHGPTIALVTYRERPQRDLDVAGTTSPG